MNVSQASAPGKVILFGEHSVVYGQPAIAVPVNQVQARAKITPQPQGTENDVYITAPDIRLSAPLSKLPPDHPFEVLLAQFKKILDIPAFPPFNIHISSTIPISAGLGSGAAISTAIIRALTQYLNIIVTDKMVSEIVYQAEKIYHGNPSGIDNTVIAFNQPVFFIRDTPFVQLNVHDPFSLVIGDSGEKSSTIKVVSEVRQRWNNSKKYYEDVFSRIGQISRDAKNIIETDQSRKLGKLMTENHRLLQEIGISTNKLDQLVDAALAAGASGAKLSGAGGGGNMIALVETQTTQAVEEALIKAGASRIITTRIENPKTISGD